MIEGGVGAEIPGEERDSAVLVVVVEAARKRLPLDPSLLRRRGLDVALIFDDQDAIEHLRSRDTGLLVLAPEGTGEAARSLCREIRSLKGSGETFLLVVAAAGEAEIATELCELGADEVLYAPFNETDFCRKVGELLSVPVREAVRVPVEIEVSGIGGKGTVLGVYRDLSVSGALLEVQGSDEIPEELILSFQLPGEAERVKATALVIRIRPTASGRFVGLRFKSLSQPAFSAVRRFIDDRALIGASPEWTRVSASSSNRSS